MLIKTLRTNFWLKSLIPVVVGNLYIWMFLFQIPLNLDWARFLFLFLSSSLGFATLGYFINDYFDVQNDALSGKVNYIGSLNPTKQISILFSCLFVAVFPWFFLEVNLIIILLLVFQTFLYLIYSVPPFRLKQKPFLSNIADAAYAYAIPLLIAFFAVKLKAKLNEIHSVLIVLFFLNYMVVGYRNLLTHQFQDIEYDNIGGIQTTASFLGIGSLKYVFFILLFLEFVLLMGVLYFLQSFPLNFILLLISVGIYLNGFYEFVIEKRLNVKILKIGLFSNSIYQFYFPFAVLVLLTIQVDKIWFLVVLVHLFVFSDWITLKKRFAPNSIIKDFWHKVIKPFMCNVIKPLIGFLVNHGIYFLFKLAGVNLKKENKSAIAYLKEKLF
jgi:4-hydroxybenzoate polyprenyltransferase